MNTEAEQLRDKYYQSVIEFQESGAFYNTSQLPNKSQSGEYLLDKKRLFMEWETGEKDKFKIVKLTSDVLVVKDSELKIIFHYNKWILGEV